MKLEKWALIAEVVGGIAIVGSLILLILEVRAGTDLARISAYEEITRDFEDWRFRVVTDPDSYELFYRWQSGNLPNFETEPEAALKMQLLLLNDLGIHERAYLAYQAGIVGDAEWDRLHRSECAQWNGLAGTDFIELLKFRLTDSYVEQLEADCDHIDANAGRFSQR